MSVPLTQALGLMLSNLERGTMAIPRIVAALLLAMVAIAQTVRFFLEWPVTINGFSVPLWASAVLAVVCAGIAVMLWRDGVTKRQP